MLRESDDELLRDLLMDRPDLAVPPPTTFSQVASRATTRESVRLALDQLNVVELWVAQLASTAFPPISAAGIIGLEPDVAAQTLERLRRLALVWGTRAAVRPVRALPGELLAAGAPRTTPPDIEPPTPHGMEQVDAARVDKLAAGAAFELVRRMEVLVEHADHTAIRLRQDGGLAHREGRTLGHLLDVSSGEAFELVTMAQAAGLVGLVPHGRPDLLVPTEAFDTWLDGSLAEQWARVLQGWVGGHPQSGSRRLKEICLAAYGRPGSGRVIDPAHLGAWLRWHRPRIADDAIRRVTTMSRQAGWLGVTALGALASFGLGSDLSILSALLPARTDSVLLQNDLTAVAPAPLTGSASRELGALADVESRGGATVYRFSVESLERAKAAGWSAARIREALERLSRTPVPQPLAYLVADLDRPRPVTTTARRPRIPAPTVHGPADLRGLPAPLAGAEASAIADLDAAIEMIAHLRAASTAETEDADPERWLTPTEGITDSPLQTLREAVETGEVVWIGYVDPTGSPSEALVCALSVEDDRLIARPSRTGTASGPSLIVPVHRISAAHIIRGHSL